MKSMTSTHAKLQRAGCEVPGMDAQLSCKNGAPKFIGKWFCCFCAFVWSEGTRASRAGSPGKARSPGLRPVMVVLKSSRREVAAAVEIGGNTIWDVCMGRYFVKGL